MFGSCKALYLSYPGYCAISLSRTCSNKDCHCDKHCHSNNDCCSDIADIGCYPNRTLGNSKSDNHTIHLSHLFEIHNI